MSTVANVKNMRLKFPGVDSLLFKDFSLSLKKGEKVLILGPSGSGKSTLLQVLTGLIPHAVEVPMKTDEINIPDSWGYLFQDPDSQFCMPFVDEEIAFVLENLQIPKEEMNRYIHHYLHQVGLAFKNPHTKIQTLSGGMKQRLAIASVLALEPEVLFLDEPTAMLDSEGTKQVWETIKQVGEDKTVVIVEHKIEEVVDFVDRVVLLDEQGVIIADGSKDEVFASYKQVLLEHGIWYPGVWRDYLNSKPPSPSPSPVSINPSVHLSDFSVYRGKSVKLHIPQANAYPGDWVTIIGENGAGKSTLLLAMMNLLKTKGTCHFLGQDYKSIKNFADHVAFVFQNPEFQFVTNSVYEEAAYSLRLDHWTEEQISPRVNQLLKTYHLENHTHIHPYQLSIGQKRRLSVAASIIKEQSIILLDEPTFGQDAKNTFAILEQLEQLRRQGKTIIMVTHDRNIVEYFSTKVWSIHDGKLANDSSTGEYLESNNHVTGEISYVH
ncbi:energy-coupling factor transport system ATP-binding protein [Halobacillus karajensis]|uniref:ABC transporter ATP-binding protein n=1 Tax=Halobacillus karajensis TaxID=195088 RepID=UPI0008A7EAFC|nr:ABC transporter ATP-binding protein [Halobacillus karajensis]SEI00162.1 energy-coupling factor transport system ATP-binding protein [Halobacillus karajensis]